ncbi:MAG: hypothetical protein JKZ00_07125 [Flavobacteriaceae bacterium]|nr:hypothetical protein [Flavobacteriaceae bacterium]
MNRSFQLSNWVPFAVSMLYILLFVYAAFSKLLDFENFRLQLSQSPMLTSFAGIIAYGIPILELLLAITLAINKLRTIALYASLGLMTSFSIYIIAILTFSDFVPCSCGGILESLGWTEHLIFNLIFVVLAIVAIILMNPPLKKRKFIPISITLLLSSALVLGVFFYTDYKNHLPGSFIRVFPPHPISEVKTKISLAKDQFQFAGITKTYLYLHEKGNPLELLQLNDNLSKTATVRLKIPKNHQLNLSRTEIAINDLGVFITDVTKPILLKGNTSNWKLKAIDLESNYFNSAVVIDTNLLAVTKLIPKKGRLLGILNTNTLTTHLNPVALEKQVDGFFCTDGFMHYNPELQKLIYTYYYRNEYVIMNKDLRITANYRTIDTTTTAKIKLRTLEKSDQRSLAKPPPIVNRRSFSQGRWLFNQSKIRAKNESQIRFKNGSVIDVYELKTGIYSHSFYIPHIKGQRLKDYWVKNNQLFVLYPNQLVSYHLFNDYLQPSINESVGQNDILHVETGK